MLVLFSVVSCLLFIFYLYRYFTVYRYLNNIGGPPGHPIIGHVIEVGSNPKEYLATLMKWAKEFRYKLHVLWLGPHPYLVVSDPKDVETVLSSTTLLKKTDVYDYLYPWLQEGLLTSHGSKWHKRRKMITPSFHFKILIDFLDVMNTCSDKFIDKLQAKSKAGNVFDFQSMAQYCTLDVICETAMGIQINAMDNSDSEIAIAFHDMCSTVQNRIFSVVKRYDALFKFTSDYRKQQKALRFLNKFTWDVIEKRRTQIDRNDNISNDIGNDDMVRKKQAFLDTLITATIDGVPLSNSDIAEEVSTFIFEGHDTTTSGITFATYILSRHPNIQQKVLDEQKAIFGSDKTRHPTYQEIQDMKYLELVIKESQRLYPSVPLIGRYTEEKMIIGGKVIPPKTGIMVNIIAMGYNENCFKDPFKVDPERFERAERENSNPYDYVPFSAGPRNCIGQKFAMLEMKTILSKMVRNFEILPPVNGLRGNGYFDDMSESSQYYPILSAILTLKSDNGVQIRLRARNM